MNTVAIFACLGCIALATGCNKLTYVGDACGDAGCALPSVSCTDAKQQLPAACDATTHSCDGGQPADDQAMCAACGINNQKLGVANTKISQCACAYCAAQLSACFDSDVSENDAGMTNGNPCQAIVQCGWANACSGSECYCGKGVDRVTCLQDAKEGHPQGPCAYSIAAAAGCMNADNVGDCVLSQQLTRGSVLYRATDVAQCVTGDPLVHNSAITPQCPPSLYVE